MNKECKGDKCALSLMHPNTNADVACDNECYFKTNLINKKNEDK